MTERTKGQIAQDKQEDRRSPHWDEVRDAYLWTHTQCAACSPGQSSSASIQIHHIFPFHYCIELGRPDLELDARNFIPLCEDEAGRNAEDHHILLGHLGDFQSGNRDVETDVKTFFGKTEAAIKADPAWKAMQPKRFKRLGQMTQADKDALRKEMDQRFPKR
jgi:hypothetical protein